MPGQDTMIKSIEYIVDCFEGSKTEENKTYVDGVIYGMKIAVAVIAAAIKHDKESNDGNAQSEKE